MIRFIKFIEELFLFEKDEDTEEKYEFSFNKEQIIELRNSVKQNCYSKTSIELLNILNEVNF